MLDKLNTIKKDLEKAIIRPGIILSTCLVADQGIKESFEYNDSTYAPFYYHLGKYVETKKLLILGLDAGLLVSCFLKSCKTVDTILAFQEKKEYYSPRIPILNLRRHSNAALDVYCGELLDADFQNKILKEKWDCILINLDLSYDKLRNYYDVAWNNLKLDGIMVIESSVSESSKKAAKDFLTIIQKDYLEFDTRYNVVVIEK